MTRKSPITVETSIVPPAPKFTEELLSPASVQAFNASTQNAQAMDAAIEKVTAEKKQQQQFKDVSTYIALALGVLAGAAGVLVDVLDVMALGLTPVLGVFTVGGIIGLRLVKNSADHFDAIANLPWLAPWRALGRSIFVGDGNRLENLKSFIYSVPNVTLSALMGLGAAMGVYASLSTTALLAVPTPITWGAAFLIGLGNFTLGHLGFMGSQDLEGKQIGVFDAVKQYWHQLRLENWQVAAKRVASHLLVTAVGLGFFLPGLLTAGPLGIVIGAASLLSVTGILNRIDLPQDIANFFSAITFTKNSHASALDLAWNEAKIGWKVLGIAASIGQGAGAAILTTHALIAGGALASIGFPPVALGVIIGVGMGFLFYGMVKQLHFMRLDKEKQAKYTQWSEIHAANDEIATLKSGPKNNNPREQVVNEMQKVINIHGKQEQNIKLDKVDEAYLAEVASSRKPGIFASSVEIAKDRYRQTATKLLSQGIEAKQEAAAARKKID